MCQVSFPRTHLTNNNMRNNCLSTSICSLKKVKGVWNFSIQTTWDGQCLCHDPVKISLGEASTSDLVIKIEAPFFNSPAKPNGPPGQPFPQLWDYEVVEAFFLNDQNQYLEVELSPHGQHLLLLLNGRRNMVKDKLPLNFTASINGDNWSGEARIPRDYLPSAVTKFNAYAIHGEGEKRQYEALYPVTEKTKGMVPDFHRLELFQPLDISSILYNYNPAQVSTLWSSELQA